MAQKSIVRPSNEKIGAALLEVARINPGGVIGQTIVGRANTRVMRASHVFAARSLLNAMGFERCWEVGANG